LSYLLFIIIKIKAIHTNRIAFLDTGFFQFLQDTALPPVILAEGK